MKKHVRLLSVSAACLALAAAILHGQLRAGDELCTIGSQQMLTTIGGAYNCLQCQNIQGKCGSISCHSDSPGHWTKTDGKGIGIADCYWTDQGWHACSTGGSMLCSTTYSCTQVGCNNCTSTPDYELTTCTLSGGGCP